MGNKDNSNELKPMMNSEEFERASEAALRELHDVAEALIKALGKRRNPNSIRNKRIPRVVHLPQPIAQLACSGLLDNIDVSYIVNWQKGEVLLVYADDQTEEAKSNFEKDKFLFAKYYNAVVMGNLAETMVTEAFIGFVRLGNKVTNENKKQGSPVKTCVYPYIIDSL